MIDKYIVTMSAELSFARHASVVALNEIYKVISIIEFADIVVENICYLFLKLACVLKVVWA